MAGKNIQDELGAIQNAARERLLKIAQLRGRQVVIEEHQVGFRGRSDAGDLLDLARADQRGRVKPGASLHDLGNYHSTGARNQLAELGKRFFSVQFGDGNLRRLEARPRERILGLARRFRARGILSRMASPTQVHAHQNGALQQAIRVGRPVASFRRTCFHRTCFHRLGLLPASYRCSAVIGPAVDAGTGAGPMPD